MEGSVDGNDARAAFPRLHRTVDCYNLIRHDVTQLRGDVRDGSVLSCVRHHYYADRDAVVSVTLAFGIADRRQAMYIMTSL